MGKEVLSGEFKSDYCKIKASCLTLKVNEQLWLYSGVCVALVFWSIG